MPSNTASTSPKVAQSRVVSVLLHAHLPYGIRPDLEHSLEQAWLCEAMTTCYLPLIGLLERLEPKTDGPWLTVSLSPTLLEMWRHPEFAARYRRHLDAGLEILQQESRNTDHPKQRRALAEELAKMWTRTAAQFEKLRGDPIRAFAGQCERGVVELITTAATHAFLPAYQNNPGYRRLQIQTGLETFKQCIGHRPDGFWIPECAYFPDLEDDLKAEGIRYFGLEGRGLTAASPATTVRQPMRCSNGLHAFGRDNGLSEKVWSARIGYPGHPDYREFHKDGVYDLSSEESGVFSLPEGGRLPLGLKYWRVTGSSKKHWYEPEQAKAKVREDAKDFISHLEEAEPGLIFLPFDAELFGHWWHEGPYWLEQVLKGTQQSRKLQLTAAGALSDLFPDAPQGQPAASTWGRKSDYSFWINQETDWIYPLIEQATCIYGEILTKHSASKKTSAREKRLIQQLGRELLLAGASDWLFMIRAGSTVDYAKTRLRQHFKRFYRLAQMYQAGSIDPQVLEALETLDPIFKDLCLEPPYPEC